MWIVNKMKLRAVKKIILSTNTVRHILILLFAVAQGPSHGTKLTKINY